MLVLFDEIDYSFTFYSFGQHAPSDVEMEMLKRDLSNIMMSDDRFEHFEGRINLINETLIFEKPQQPHRLRSTQGIGKSIELRFHTPQGATMFKLAYIEGDQFIPWIHRR